MMCLGQDFHVDFLWFIFQTTLGNVFAHSDFYQQDRAEKVAICLYSQLGLCKRLLVRICLQVVGSFCLRNTNQLRKRDKNIWVSAKSVEKWLFCGYFWGNCTQMLDFGRVGVIELSSLLIWPGCLVLAGKSWNVFIFDEKIACFYVGTKWMLKWIEWLGVAVSKLAEVGFEIGVLMLFLVFWCWFLMFWWFGVGEAQLGYLVMLGVQKLCQAS